MTKKESPYLKEGRLSQVIAAIQVMGVYKFYKRKHGDWATSIDGGNNSGINWETVFKEHPEFFRVDRQEESASLVWRRNLPKLYNVDLQEKITIEAYKQLSYEQKERISRNPLRDEDINMLIDSAIKLHESAIKHKTEKRWWISPLLVIIGLLIGSIPTIIREIKPPPTQIDTYKVKLDIDSITKDRLTIELIQKDTVATKSKN